MSTRDWKIGEVVYLKSGSPAMTVIGTDSHGATTVRWYDPQAVEMERSMYPTVVFPKDCLTEAEVPVRMPSSAWRVPQLQAEPIRIDPSDLPDVPTQHILSTIDALLARVYDCMPEGKKDSLNRLHYEENPGQLIERLLLCPSWPLVEAQALWDRMQKSFPRSVVPSQPNEKIVEATTRAAESQHPEQATAQPTVLRTEPVRAEPRRKGS